VTKNRGLERDTRFYPKEKTRHRRDEEMVVRISAQKRKEKPSSATNIGGGRGSNTGLYDFRKKTKN